MRSQDALRQMKVKSLGVWVLWLALPRIMYHRRPPDFAVTMVCHFGLT